MTRFKTIEDLEKFKDSSMVCLCGRLATGLHISSCSKILAQERRLKAKAFVSTLTNGMNITHSTDRLATISPMVKQ